MNEISVAEIDNFVLVDGFQKWYTEVGGNNFFLIPEYAALYGIIHNYFGKRTFLYETPCKFAKLY